MMKLVKFILAITSVLVAFQLHAADGVARATFTTAITDHEPIDEVTELSNDTSKIYYFTEIRGLEGQTITHRWELNGEVQASVSIPIGGNRWRIWSSKNLAPESTGKWQVMVLDEAGGVLSQNNFDYVATNTDSDATIEVTAETSPQTSNTEQTTSSMSEEELKNIAPSAGGNTTPFEADTTTTQ